MLSIRNYSIFFAVWWVGAAAVAQTVNPPPLNPYSPPWSTATPTPTPGGDSFFVPVQPPSSEGFDYFDDEEESGGGRGGSMREGKDSFKMVSPSAAPVCRKWGHSLVGGATFGDKGACEFELERKVDQGKASIEELYDKIERFKLKKVIRGELVNRSEANKYTVNFDMIMKTLQEASLAGCACRD